MMMGNKTQENTQNAAKQTKNKQPNNNNQNKTKGQKAESPSKTTVFPLYGGETGFFFARVGALCVLRGTSHRVEFVWGV